ncbi:MAG TPA: Crp/Fnr family transcriptional regulator [Candidatus Kapabacteria bacterium]|nr:Crp/Fnr family transcriptional regulator [Candidatus Kapabacteria bacterium]
MSRAQCAVPDCTTCSTRDSSVFTELLPPDLAAVSANKGCRLYAKGELIFYADTIPSGLYCIHRGNVKLYKVGRDGREQIIRIAGEGDIVGYRALISGEKYSMFAMPMEDSQICHIPRHVFLGLLGTSGNLSARIIALLSQELRAAEERIVEMAQKPVRERLAEALLLLLEKHGTANDNSTLGITITRSELANIAGTTAESVSRVLSKLKAEGVLAVRGRQIGILDRHALTEAANLEN